MSRSTPKFELSFPPQFKQLMHKNCNLTAFRYQESLPLPATCMILDTIGMSFSNNPWLQQRKFQSKIRGISSTHTIKSPASLLQQTHQ